MDDEPRTARARQRREQILDAASICFARYGFHGASVAQISKQACMSPGHIYHFFDNKEAIVGGIVERMAARFKSLLEHLVEGGDPRLGELRERFGEPAPVASKKAAGPRRMGPGRARRRAVTSDGEGGTRAG